MADPLSRIPESTEVYKAKAPTHNTVCNLMVVRQKGKKRQATQAEEINSLASRIQQAYGQEPRLEELKKQQELIFRDGFWM